MAGGVVAGGAGGLAANWVKQNRRKWSDKLREAEWWVAQARKSAKSGDYKASRSDALMACALMDEACQYDTEPKE